MNQEIRNSIASLLLVTLIGLILTVATYFGVNFLINLNDELITTQVEALKLQRNLSNIIAFRALLEGTAIERENIDSFFLKSDEEIIEFIKELEDLASNTGLVFSFDISEEAEEKDKAKSSIKNIMLSIRITGEYSNVYQFIRLLELIDNKIKFNEVSLRVLGGQGDARSWTSSIAIDVLGVFD